MSKSKICLIALGIVAIAAVAWFIWKPKDLAETNFPKRACGEVFLPAAGRPVLHRFEKCGKEGQPASAEVEFADGRFELITLRADRTALQSVEYYPGEGELQTRQVRSQATFETDGETYQTHQVYRLDGTLERSGRGQKTDDTRPVITMPTAKHPAVLASFYANDSFPRNAFEKTGRFLPA